MQVIFTLQVPKIFTLCPLSREFFTTLGPSLAILSLPKGSRVLHTTLERSAPIQTRNQDEIVEGRHTFPELMKQRPRIAVKTLGLCL